MTPYIRFEYKCENCGFSYFRRWDGKDVPIIHLAKTCPDCKKEAGKMTSVRYVDQDGDIRRFYEVIDRTYNHMAGYQGMSTVPVLEEFKGLGIDGKVIIDANMIWFNYRDVI